jgi:chromosome segregation ATPase
MSSDDASPLRPAPAGRADTLAEEVRQLKALLAELQAELGPGISASLRERSSELQRMGAELDERQTEAQQAQRELDQAQARAADLEREVERWRGAATRGVDEIAERARAQTARFEALSQALEQALAELRAQLDLSKAQAQAATEARDGAVKQLEQARRRVRSLKAKVLRREKRRVEMMRSASWRITAPLRWIPAAGGRLMLGLARLRRRLLKR